MKRTNNLIALSGIVASLAACAAPAAFAGDERAVLNFKSCAKPVYPAQSLAARHEGTVTLSFDVEADGTISGSKVKTSSGHPLMDDAAHHAIKKCSFKPATSGGKATRSTADIQYVWTLTEPKKG